MFYEVLIFGFIISLILIVFTIFYFHNKTVQVFGLVVYGWMSVVGGGKPGLQCKASILLRSCLPKPFAGFGFLYV